MKNQWAVQTNDYPGCEYDEWGPKTVGYVSGKSGEDALQNAQVQFPDVHIMRLLGNQEVYENPNTSSPFPPFSWRDTADKLAEETRMANSKPYTDGFSIALDGLFSMFQKWDEFWERK